MRFYRGSSGPPVLQQSFNETPNFSLHKWFCPMICRCLLFSCQFSCSLPLITAHSRSLPLITTHYHSLPLTPARADAWISTGEWEKPICLLICGLSSDRMDSYHRAPCPCHFPFTYDAFYVFCNIQTEIRRINTSRTFITRASVPVSNVSSCSPYQVKYWWLNTADTGHGSEGSDKTYKRTYHFAITSL